MNSRIIRALIVFLAVFFTGTSLWAVDCIPALTNQIGHLFVRALVENLSFDTSTPDGVFRAGDVRLMVRFSNNNPANCSSAALLNPSAIAEEAMTPQVYRGLIYMSKLIEMLIFAQQKNVPVDFYIHSAEGRHSIITHVSLRSPEGEVPPPQQNQQPQGQGGQQQQGQQGQQGQQQQGQQGQQQQCPQETPYFCQTNQQCVVTQADCPAQ